MNILSILSPVFWGLVVLSLLVFVHEAGHYLAARAFGVRVTEFFLGMPFRYKLSYKRVALRSAKLPQSSTLKTMLLMKP